LFFWGPLLQEFYLGGNEKATKSDLTFEERHLTFQLQMF
jgi:hypothetical protein